MAVYGTGYIRTIQGILKISETVVCFIGFLLAIINTTSADLLKAVIAGFIIGLIVAIVIFVLHVTKLGSSIDAILAFQLYFYVLWFVYMLIVSALLISKDWGAQYMATGAFGIILMILHLVDAIDCFRLNPSPVFCIRS